MSDARARVRARAINFLHRNVVLLRCTTASSPRPGLWEANRAPTCYVRHTYRKEDRPPSSLAHPNCGSSGAARAVVVSARVARLQPSFQVLARDSHVQSSARATGAAEESTTASSSTTSSTRRRRRASRSGARTGRRSSPSTRTTARRRSRPSSCRRWTRRARSSSSRRS